MLIWVRHFDAANDKPGSVMAECNELYKMRKFRIFTARVLSIMIFNILHFKMVINSLK